jgi:signal transduction histidine kinase
MRERLESIGGEFAIHSVAGQGTCLVARLPYNPGIQ